VLRPHPRPGMAGKSRSALLNYRNYLAPLEGRGPTKAAQVAWAPTCQAQEATPRAADSTPHEGG
jgi:hypothetical protein